MNPASATTAEMLEAALAEHRAGRLPQAEQLYRTVLAAEPNNADALHLLGMLAHACRQPQHAVDLIGRAIAINPHVAAFHCDLAIVLRDVRRYDEALNSVKRALASDRAAEGPLFVLASILHARGEFEAAAEACERLLSMHPRHVAGHLLAGAAALRLVRVRQAITLAERAISIEPQNASAHWNLAWALLLDGQLERGWEEFEWRLRPGGRIPPRPDLRDKPLWRRQDISAATILLYCEGGFGDALQFVRYVPMVTQRAARVLLECPAALFDLFKFVHGAERVIVRGRPLPDFDVACPLQSLPYNFRTTLETIPADVPYLAAEEQLIRQWSDRLPRGFKIGLAWAGSNNPADRRSRTLATFAPLAAAADVYFISLQIGDDARQAKSPPAGVTLLDMSGRLTDFAQTAALMANLDLIITVETSVAHLAGALAKPVWVLVPFGSDFRWMLGRTDSPWYPTMRLFRQSDPQDWHTPVGQMAAALRELRAGAN